MLKLGERVIVNPDHDPRGRFTGVVYEVERFKTVNVLLKPVAGPHDGRKLNSRPEYLLSAPDEASGMTETAVTVGQPFLPNLWAGQVVTVKSTHRRWHYAVDQRFVVISSTVGRVKVAKIGGEDGMTWTVPRGSVTVIEVSQLCGGTL